MSVDIFADIFIASNINIVFAIYIAIGIEPFAEFDLQRDSSHI